MPTSDPNNLFGRFVTRRDVELAVVAFLQSWIPTYIVAVESQSGLPSHTIPFPPDRNLSYRGGMDWNTWRAEWSPIYIVNAQANGGPVRLDPSGRYAQAFDVAVCCNIQLTSQMLSLSPHVTGLTEGGLEEDTTRQFADMYGFAAAAAVMQHAGLGTWPDGTTVSSDTKFLEYPRTSFPFPDNRRVGRSVFVVSAFVDSVLTSSDGPREPLVDPYETVPDLADVSEITIELETDGSDEDTEIEINQTSWSVS